MSHLEEFQSSLSSLNKNISIDEIYKHTQEIDKILGGHNVDFEIKKYLSDFKSLNIRNNVLGIIICPNDLGIPLTGSIGQAFEVLGHQIENLYNDPGDIKKKTGEFPHDKTCKLSDNYGEQGHKSCRFFYSFEESGVDNFHLDIPPVYEKPVLNLRVKKDIAWQFNGNPVSTKLYRIDPSRIKLDNHSGFKIITFKLVKGLKVNKPF